MGYEWFPKYFAYPVSTTKELEAAGDPRANISLLYAWLASVRRSAESNIASRYLRGAGVSGGGGSVDLRGGLLRSGTIFMCAAMLKKRPGVYRRGHRSARFGA